MLIRPDHLGDVLFTTPALRLLRHSLPEAEISCLVGPWARPVLVANKNVDKLQTCSFPWFDGQPYSPIRSYRLLFDQARKLRERKFDAAINLRFDYWWGAALAYLAAIYWRVGYSIGLSARFLHPAISYAPGRHEARQNLRLVESFLRLLDRPIVTVTTSEWISLDYTMAPEDQAFAERYLRANGITPQHRLLILHPGTRGASKRWMPERFAAVGDALATTYGMRVAITGNREERPLAESIARTMVTAAHVAAGETTIGELAALFSRAALAIGVDSGPMHLAAALHCPTVHLYGPSDHVAFAPCGDPLTHSIVRAEMDCSPCHRFDWPKRELLSHACMTSVSVEQVLRTAGAVIVCGRSCYDGAVGRDD